MLTETRTIDVGKSIHGWSPGWHIRRIRIDNPSGRWLQLSTGDYIPPFTFGYDRSFDVGLASIDIIALTSGPAGLPSVDSGSYVTVRIDDIGTGTSVPGYTILGPGAITGDLIANATITGSNIQNGTITGNLIANATITGSNIQNGTITGNLIANATITGSNIQNGTITGGNIANLTITAGNIANLTITTSKIADGAITNPKVAAGAIDTAQLAATATIRNVQNGPATVSINDTGLTINNGALIFNDRFGTTVLTGSGFDKSWYDYLYYGYYNALFTVGSTSNIPVSEVNGGNSATDYANSISPNLPYWIVAASGGTLARVADSSAVGGSVLRNAVSAGQTNRIYQDIPIVPGSRRLLMVRYKVTQIAAGSVTVGAYWSYRTTNHVLIGSRTSLGNNTHFGNVASFIQQFTPTTTAPTNAGFVRFELEVIGNSGTFQVNIEAIWSPFEADPNFGDVYLSRILPRNVSTIFVNNASLSVDNDVSAGGDLYVSGPSGIFLSDGGQLQRIAAGESQFVGSMVQRGYALFRGRSTTLSISSGSMNKVAYDTTIYQRLITYNGTNNTFVVSRPGLYIIHQEVTFPTRSDYTRFILAIGTAANNGNPTVQDADGENTLSGIGNFNYHVKRQWIRWLNANDAVAFFVHQTNSGGASVATSNHKGALIYLGGL
jgi:hypothetical protein